MSETLSVPEQAVPAKKTIEQFETKLLEAGSNIESAQSKVDALNFKSDATDHVMAKAELRDAESEYQPQVASMSAEWESHGGARLDAARVAVDALNFKSSATDHVMAKKELQSAEDAWAESYAASNSDAPSAEGKELVPVIADVGDIVKVGKNGDTYHKPDGSFVSADHMQLVEAHQDQIRSGLDDRSAEVSAVVVEDKAESEAKEGALPPEGNPAEEGEFLEQYEARNNVAVDTLEDIKLAPSPEESPKIDTLEDVKLAEVPGTEADDKKLDTSGLDVEEQSIWKRIRKGTKDRYLKAAALFGTTAYAVGEVLPRPTQHMGETHEDFEKRVKWIGAAKILGFIAVVATAKYGLDHDWFGGNGDNIGNIPDTESLGASGGGYSTLESQVEIPETPEVPVAPEFSAEAHTVTDGEGWYNTMKEMGITDATERASLLQKVGPQLKEMGYAYPMEDGTWGINMPGQLPNDVLELIKNSR